jgi:hypothetical protein
MDGNVKNRKKVKQKERKKERNLRNGHKKLFSP